MLGPFVGWLVCLILIAIAGGVAFQRRGATYALGIIVALSFVCPVWLEIQPAGIPLNVQTCAAMMGLLLMVFTAPWKIRAPLVLLDVIIAALVILNVLSDVYHGRDPLQCGLMAYGEWALPYVAGRYAVRDANCAEDLAVLISVILLIMGLSGMIEALAGINIWEVIFGDRPVEGFSRAQSRFGIKRAFGPTLHPIFFGLLMLVLSPWPIALTRWARSIPQRALAVGGLAASLIGSLATVSRSPVLGVGVLFAAVLAIWSPLGRKLILGLSVAAVIWAAIDYNSILVKFEEMGGESRQISKYQLDGEELELSAVTHRLVAVQVFWPAMLQSGWLGYGSEATSDLPPQVPFLPKNERVRQMLRFVDNAYLMYGLRFGWTGAVLFLLLEIVAIWTGISLVWDRSLSLLAGSIAAMTISMAGVLITVWLSYDMGFEYLWTFGVLGGFASQQKEFQR